jgi:3-oxoacyl-(acyl-carrier-protein) synthase
VRLRCSSTAPVSNSAAGIAGLEHRLRGPNMTLSHKEASGLAAIVTAVDLIRESAPPRSSRRRRRDLRNLLQGARSLRGHVADEAFSARLAPFDAQRDGFALGEGAFGLWLECTGHADERACTARFLGVATSSAGRADQRVARSGRTRSRGRCGWHSTDAGLEPDAVDVVYASANATRALDAAEAQALTTMFGGGRAIVTSVKGALGEFGAAGARRARRRSCAGAWAGCLRSPGSRTPTRRRPR